MGKRRNASKKSDAGAEGSAASSVNDGGGRSNSNMFSAFDFNNDDLLVEAQSREALSKFGTQSPSSKPRRRKSIDKYDYLKLFTQGIDCKQKHFANVELGVAASAVDGKISLGSSKYEPGPLSSPECQSSVCTCGVKSCLGRRKPGCRTTGKKHNQVLNLDSDDDERLELLSLGSSINMGENEGSLKEQLSEYGANSNDCEALVVVAPYYVKLEKSYYKRCVLTFSRRCIRLEGSSFCDRKGTLCVEWPISDILYIEHQQCDNAEVINAHLRYKDANADETDNSTLGIVELEFVILDDPRWSEKQEEIKSLDFIYEVSWKTIVTECCFEESFEEVVYPDGDPDAVIISRRDIELLQPMTFINDTIIDFYIRYLQTKTKAEQQHRFHFFNTFFFQKLLAGGHGGRDAFLSVHKWTRNVNLFEKDYIFIPVNSSLHWSLIIICHLGEAANLKSKNTDQSSKVPCILHMDSIRGSHRGFEKFIRSYLWEEWKERGNEQEEEIAVKFMHLDFVSLQLPQQDNLFDCGLFLLHYAELFLELVSKCSTAKYIDFLNQDWFLPAEVSLKKRDHIRKLIHKLIQDNAQKDPATASNKKYPQKLGRGVGESSARSVLKDGGKDLSHGINLNLVDDLDTPGQQCFAPILEQRNTGKSSRKECHQPRKLRVPINHFNNLSWPIKGTLAKQTTVPQRDVGGSYEKDEEMPPRCHLNHLLGGEAFYDESVQNTESGDEKSSTTSKDLAACVVEDSEDESEVQSIRRTRRHLIIN